MHRRQCQRRRPAGELSVDAGGWLLLRAWNDGADPQVLDLYPYATTSPIYLEMPGRAPSAKQDAAYFGLAAEGMLAFVDDDLHAMVDGAVVGGAA